MSPEGETGSGPGARAGAAAPGGAGPGRGDDVDRVIAAWQRQRPDLDLTPLSVLSRVSRLARRLDRARDRAFAQHGLAVWEFDVLVALRRTGPPYRLTPGQLLDETLVTSGTMTNRIDRLERRGLVVREPVPDDRRVTLVALTPGGRERVDAAFEDLLAEERQLLADLDPAARTELAAGLRRLLLQFEAPPGDPAA
jgi:DNA-binding MarR family transcriptional regulator